MADVRWLDDGEAAAWRGLMRMQAHLAGALARRLAEDSSLSYPDYEVLVALTDRPDGRMRLFELADELAWEKSRLSHHVSRMVDRGLVAKEACPTDRRGSFVVVTPQGSAAITAAAPGHVAAVRELFVDRLDDEQLAAVATVAATVLAGLEEGPA